MSQIRIFSCYRFQDYICHAFWESCFGSFPLFFQISIICVTKLHYISLEFSKFILVLSIFLIKKIRISNSDPPEKSDSSLQARVNYVRLFRPAFNIQVMLVL
jgi:hypothetical protein